MTHDATTPALTRPVFLLGAHKSGTSLLRSLLDGHPELFVVPIETHLFKRAGYWVDYALGKTSRPPGRSLDGIRKGYFRVVEDYNTNAYRYGDADLVGRFDLDAFRARFDAAEADALPALIAAYFDAIHASLTGEPLPADRRIVEKTVEHAEHAIDLKRMFPDAVFIHILRNPYANLVSIRRHMMDGPYPFLHRGIQALQNSLYFLYRNRELLEDYHVVRYEDILTEPEATMRSVAELLGLPFDPTLLQPTSAGEAWSGNSSRGESYKGVSAANLHRWKEEVTPLEVHLVTKRFPFVLEEFGYETETPARSIYRPIRRERLKTYVANRVLAGMDS